MRALRMAVLLGVVGAVAVGLVTGLASAAGKSNNPKITFVSPPSPAEGATLTTNSVTFAFTYNRTAKQTKSLTCALTGPTPSSGDCANLVYNNLGNGNYTFTAALTLTDGGTASATRHFTVNVPVSSHLYWTNYLPLPDGTITEANLDGGNPQAIATGQFSPFAVAADANHLYWANVGGITRSNLDGSNPQTIVATPGPTPPAVGLAVDASHLYWVTFSSVVEANLDGSNPQTIGTADNAGGVAVSANHLYWSNEGTGTITRSNLDGSNPQTIATGQTPVGVAVNASHLYWSNFGTFATNFTDGTIVEANLDGSNPQTIATGQAPVGVAVNTSHLYWSNFGTFATNFTDGTIVEANLDGSNPQTIATGQHQVAGLALSPG